MYLISTIELLNLWISVLKIMQLNFVLVLLCFMVTCVQILYGSTCDCLFCPDTAKIPAASKREIYNSSPCPAGTAAAVSELNVESTDKSGIRIYTKDDPSSSQSYTAGSSGSTVTCFKMGSRFLVGGVKPRIYVIIECEEWSKSCSVDYNINLVCASVGTTSTSTSATRSTSTPPTRSTFTRVSTTTSTSTPVTVPTATAVMINNTCECDCCKGSETCQAAYVGTIFYGTGKCETSDCTSKCAKQFSTCPSSRDEAGKIVAHCINNAGITLKTALYIPLLIIISLYVFDIK